MHRINVVCRCGRNLQIPVRYAGGIVRCRGCRGSVDVPVLDLDKADRGDTQSPQVEVLSNLGSVALVIVAAWSVLTVLTLVAAMVLRLPGIGIWLLLAGMLVIGASIVLRLYLAKSSAVHASEKSRSVLFGQGNLVLWEPTEGVMFLKNKHIHAVDNNSRDGGGIRVIFPILGEELGLRVPLTIQSTVFSDDNVFTRDYLPVSLRITIRWRLTDLAKYFLSISQQIDSVSDTSVADEDEVAASRGSHNQLGAARGWIAMMAESACRAEMARTQTSLLFADQISSALPAEVRHSLESGDAPVATYEATTDALGGRIAALIREKAQEYGLQIQRIELQEVRLPKSIQDAAVEACAAAFLPAKAEREAAARRIRLQADAGVLGADAVALREVLANADGMSFLSVPDFLENLFSRLGQGRRIDAKGTGQR